MGLAVGSAAVLASPSAVQAQEGRLIFNLPAQDARSALIDLCLAAGCETAFVAPPGRTLRSRAVHGQMTWRQAVAQMLEGTGLRYRFVGARGVRVWADDAPTSVSTKPPEPAQLEPVIVTGRLSEQIEESLRRKRAADVISDSASATRIGELPAANLAEALQRVPGVAVEREVGEGQFVSVRGLGPLFQSVTLNGAPVAFNENIRNSTQSGRQFRFRALSADLLAGAQLSKSATADLIEGGIGSNIDIETIGGLDGAPFISAQLGAATEARAGRPRAELSLAGRTVSSTGNWGLVGGVSQEGRSVVYDRFQLGRYRSMTIDGRPVAAPTDLRTTVEQEDRLRRSLFLGGEWRSSPRLRLRFDSLVSSFQNAIREDRLAYGLGDRLQSAGAVATVRDGVVAAGVVPLGAIDNNTEFSDQSHLNFVVSGEAEIALDQWTITPRISLSRARSRLDTPLQRISFQSRTPTAYAFDLGDAAVTRQAALLGTELDLNDPSKLVFQRFGVRAIESVDEDRTALLDLSRPVRLDAGFARVSAVRLGARYSERSRDYERRDRAAALRSGVVLTSDFHGSRTPADVFRGILSDQPGPWAVADFDRFQTAFVLPGEVDGVGARAADLVPNAADRQNSYAVQESAAAAYARLDFEGETPFADFFGNLGLRLVDTRTTVRGAILELNADGRAAVGDAVHTSSDLRLLPSLNLALDFDSRHRLRLAASRTLTRPSLADLRLATTPASSLVSDIYEHGQAAVDDPSPDALFSGVGGNPALKPYVSANLDASYEWSFSNGALSLALFRKSIEDFIGVVAAPETLIFETRDGPIVRAEVMMSRPRNLGRATSRGLEVGLHRRFRGGLGLWASVTLTDAAGPDDEARMAGVSRLAYSINPFFERGPVAAGLSWSWRSSFRSEADMQGGGVSEFTVGAAGYLDAQVSIDLGESAQIVLAAANLTDTTDLAYEQDRRRLLQLGRVGRSATISLRWRLS